MKKIIHLITSAFVASLSAATAFAAKYDDRIDDFIPPGSAGYSGYTTTKDLPTRHLTLEILPRLIKILLALGGSISFIVFVYAGIMLIVSQGKEEELTKFKNILLWSAIGLAIISLSYAIVTGILNLSFA